MNSFKKIIDYTSNLVILIIFLMFSIWFLQIESADLLPTIFSLFTIIVLSIVISKSKNYLSDIWFLDQNKKYFKTKTKKFDLSIYSLIILIFGTAFLIVFNFIIVLSFNKTYPNLTFIEAYELHCNSFLSTSKFFYVAENWYTNLNNSFQDYKNIYPLFPILIIIFSLFGNPYIFIFLLNNILFILSGILIYNLALLDFSKLTAIKSLLLFYFFPTAFLMIAPIHISLFLFFTLLYVYFIRRRMWGYSFFMGYLLGILDPFSIILLVYACVEYLSFLREEISEIRFENNKISLNKTAMFYIFNRITNKYFFAYILKGLFLLSIPFGRLFYFFVNKNVYFNKINFLLLIQSYIQEKKNFFFSNSFYVAKKFIEVNSSEFKTDATSYFIIIFSIIFILLLLVLDNKKIRGSYFLFCITYFIFYFSQKDILVTSNQLIIFFPIIFISANLSNNIFINIIIFFIYAIFMFLFLRFFLAGYPIY